MRPTTTANVKHKEVVWSIEWTRDWPKCDGFAREIQEIRASFRGRQEEDVAWVVGDSMDTKQALLSDLFDSLILSCRRRPADITARLPDIVIKRGGQRNNDDGTIRLDSSSLSAVERSSLNRTSSPRRE